MRRGATARAGFGLLTTALLVALVRPRSLPDLDLVDPAARSAQITEFGLRSLATLLAAYLAVVLLGLLLSAGRLLPASARSLVARWTTGGLAGGLRRFVGVSALTLGVLPFQPLAAHATEPAPVLAPHDQTPPTMAAPRLQPTDAAGPTTDAPSLQPTEPLAAEPPSARPVVPDPRPPGPGPALPAPVGSVTVVHGDSFWSVAERLASARLGRPAADAEVLEPWLALIEANRDRLTDPDDPDLLHPGQVLRLPD